MEQNRIIKKYCIKFYKQEKNMKNRIKKKATIMMEQNSMKDKKKRKEQ